MRIVVFLLILFSFGNLFAQHSLLKDTNYFDYWIRYQKNNKNFHKDTTLKWFNNPPQLEADSSKKIEWFQLGNINDGFKCIGFKIHPKDLVKSSSGRGFIPIMHYNLDQTNSVVDFNIYISQKIKKRWLKSETRFQKQKELDKLTYDGNRKGYYQSKKGLWNNDVIELPRDLDSSKFIWVFFTLKNQDEEIALYFPSEIKELGNFKFEKKESLNEDYELEFRDFLLKFNTDTSFQKKHINEELKLIIYKGYNEIDDIELMDTLKIKNKELSFLSLTEHKTNLFSKYSEVSLRYTPIEDLKFVTVVLEYENDDFEKYYDGSQVFLEHDFKKIEGEWFLDKVYLMLEETDKKEQKKIVKNYFLDKKVK